jgi:asparagine synthase (glutamine-hydrolysing)
MCGIAGMFGKIASPDRVNKMVAAMHRRGPDDSGVWFDAEHDVCLGQARLSIIDLSPAGHQPMFLEGRGSENIQRDHRVNRSVDFSIVFNGEIYNYKELRTELEEKGARFRTHSDTEVILWGWKIWGKETPKRLRGMFAFAMWDGLKGSLTLVRDRLGIKPLLWYRSPAGIVFASSLKAMFASGEVPRILDEQGFFDHLIFGAVCQPRTMIQGVQSVEPGTMVEFQVATGSQTLASARAILEKAPERYWSLERDEGLVRDLAILTYEEQVNLTRQKLEEACKYHLIADVPVASFLSGGVDSTVITALMSRQSTQPVKSFSIGFSTETGMQHELTEARTAAEFIGCDHKEVILTGKDVADSFDDFIDSIDQPSVDGLNTYWVSKVTRESGLKVALSGLGSDELFAGYGFFGWFDPDAPAPSWRDQVLGAAYRICSYDTGLLSSYLKTASVSEKLGLIRRRMTDAEIHKSVAPWLRDLYPKAYVQKYIAALNLNISDPIAQATQYDCRNYLLNTLLRDADALSMAHSLEVRPIFLDHELTEFALALPAGSKWGNGIGKAVLKDATKDLLPPDFFTRKKTGFTLPINYWVEHELKDRFLETIGKKSATTFFSLPLLRDLMKEKPSGRKMKLMWQVFVFLNWIEREAIEVS